MYTLLKESGCISLYITLSFKWLVTHKWYSSRCILLEHIWVFAVSCTLVSYLYLCLCHCSLQQARFSGKNAISHIPATLGLRPIHVSRTNTTLSYLTNCLSCTHVRDLGITPQQMCHAQHPLKVEDFKAHLPALVLLLLCST